MQLSFRLDKRPGESHLALDGKKWLQVNARSADVVLISRMPQCCLLSRSFGPHVTARNQYHGFHAQITSNCEIAGMTQSLELIPTGCCSWFHWRTTTKSESGQIFLLENVRRKDGLSRNVHTTRLKSMWWSFDEQRMGLKGLLKPQGHP